MSVTDAYQNQEKTRERKEEEKFKVEKEEGELYCEYCARVLRRYLELTPKERGEMKRRQEFKDALANAKLFHLLQQQVIFGLYERKNIVSAVLEAEVEDL